MRFSVREQNKKKMFFHLPAAAQKVTGLHLTTIKTILERGGNPNYHRKSDNKLFEILEEPPIKILTIEGKDFFSLEEIEKEFALSPTKFMNQVKNKKFAKEIDWISDELFPEKLQQEKEPDLQAEMKKLQEENERLSARLEDLEASLKKLSARVEKCETQETSLETSLEKASSPEKAFSPAQEFFKPSNTLDLYSLAPEIIAEFIASGFVSDIRPEGPKIRQFVLIDNRKEYLPDLVKPILQDHVLPLLENETEEEKKKRLEFYIEAKGKINGMTLGENGVFIKNLRQLKPQVIADISKAVMKLI